MVAINRDIIIETVHGMRQLVPARRVQAANWSKQMWSESSPEEESETPAVRSESQESEPENLDD